jgi:5'-nucleotidase
MRGMGWTGILAMLLLTGAQAAPGGTVPVTVIAVNDIHGNIDPPPGGVDIPDPAHPGKSFNIAAGGLDRMATLVKRLKARNRNAIFVAAGDLVGASPLLSGLFHDEPVIEAMSQMGLAASAVGNHEFDKGVPELLRLQKGGCHPVDGCKGGHAFKGARFQYLAASTTYTATGKTILPPYIVRRFDGIPVAFVGLTRRETGSMVSPESAAGLTFKDEAQSVNALVPKLKAQGINAIVVMLHKGDTHVAGGINGCDGVAGPIEALVKKFDKAVDVVITGDSHFAYNCVFDGRLVTQAYRYSTMVTRIDLKLDRRTRDVVSARAVNLVVDPGLPPDPAVGKLLDGYRRRAGPLQGRVVATIPAPLPLANNKLTQEMALGDMIADATRAASDHGRIAFMNPGGIRVALAKAGPVTHGELFAVLPFGNSVVTMDLTGAQIRALLEQQWSDPQQPRVMQVSDGFTYAWDGQRPEGQHIMPDSVKLDGVPLRNTEVYRVAMPDFLAQGGDGMKLFTQGRNAVTGGTLLEAVEAWLPTHAPATATPAGRITRLDSP